MVIGSPDSQLNPKKKIWEQIAPDLKTDTQLVATYKGEPFKVEGKGLVVAKTLANVAVKWSNILFKFSYLLELFTIN